MAKRIKIEFISNPTPTVDILFGVNYTPYSYTLNATIGIDVVVGATKEDTASNLYDFYTGEVFPAWLDAFTTISLASNIIYFE